MELTILSKTITWWQSIALGIIQGLAEFLPISSSGHLKLFENIFDIPGTPRVFDIFLHLGTLTAVIIVFRKDLWELIKHPFQKMTYLIVVATIPTVIIAVLGEAFLPDSFSDYFLGYGFMITGIALYIMEMIPKSYQKKDLDTVTYLDAIRIGCVQGIATFPGISRSGSTIAGGIFHGLDRKFLAKFSFLMSIPSVFGAFCWDFLKYLVQRDGTEEVIVTPLPVILGTISAFIVGYCAVKYMLKLIANKSFKPFAVYVFVLGFLVCLDKFVLHIVF